MATKSGDLKSDQQDPPLIMQLPAEIRLYIYELALGNILTQTDSFIARPSRIYRKKLQFRSALALLLTSKTIRAEFSEGVMPLVTARCERTSDRIEMLEVDWETKLKALAHPQPGQRIIDPVLEAYWMEMQRDHELGNAHVTMKGLSTVKHMLERTAEEFKGNLKSSNNVEGEDLKLDV
jgi:hypothetical protein